MIKNPIFLFVSLLIVALVIVVLYKIKTDPFKNLQPGSAEANEIQHNSGPIIALYNKACASCHGISGQGLAGNPSLGASKLNTEQVKQLIRSGKGNMPAFPGIQEPELSKLAELVKKLSSND